MKKTLFALAFLAAFGASAQGLSEDFETGAAVLNWQPLGQNAVLNGAFSVADNPFLTLENPSAKVGKYQKGASPFSVLVAKTPIDLSQKRLFDLHVWLPAGASSVEMQLESSVFGKESMKITGLASEKWAALSFDFSGVSSSGPFDELRILFEPGAAMAGAAFFFDDLLQNGTAPPPPPPSGDRCVADFEAPNSSLATWGAFQNGAVAAFSLVQNPLKTGLNPSEKCGKAIEGGLSSGAGQPWGGMFADLAEPIKFEGAERMRMKVLMPAAPRSVTMKLESPAGSTPDNTVTAQKTGEWEQLEWNFAAAAAGASFSRLTLIWNIEALPPTDQIYFFDDIEIGLGGACLPVSVFQPLEIEPFRVWPNPTDGLLFLEKSGSFEVFDALGRRVLTFFSSGEKGSSADVSGLPTGLYFLKNEASARRFFKN